MHYRIAVVGATGNVGRKIIEILAYTNFPAKEVIALASSRSVGKQISYGDKKLLKVESLSNYDFSGTDIVFFAAGKEVSKLYVKKAVDCGSFVIDNSSYFRMDNDVPLVIPEVNPEDLKILKKSKLVSNPNCAVIQLLVALKPLDDIAELKRIVVSTYQSVSGAGKAAMDELFNQTKSVYVNQKLPPQIFDKQIAFNLIPYIGKIMDDGYCEEEHKIMNEAKKIMGSNLQITANCVRVPVFVGHSIHANCEFYEKLTRKDAASALRKSEAVVVSSDSIFSPAEIVGEDLVYISRLRKDLSKENSLDLWIVADNIRKGAATNAVQIAFEIIKDYI